MSRLGDIFVGENLITLEQLCEALGAQSSGGGRLGSCLVRQGHISEAVFSAEGRVRFRLGRNIPVQIKYRVGFDFAASLRSFLRLAPDIILSRRDEALLHRRNCRQRGPDRSPRVETTTHERCDRDNAALAEYGNRSISRRDFVARDLRATVAGTGDGLDCTKLWK